MFIAQQLYEGVQLGEKGLTGLASYIRTDSVRINTDFQVSTREFIKINMVKIICLIHYRNTSLKRYTRCTRSNTPSYIDCEPSTIEKYLTKEQFNCIS